MGETETETDSEIDPEALVQLLSPESKIRIVSAVLQEGRGGEIFNPSRVYEHDGVSRDAWYRYHEDLIEGGLIEQEGKVGNSPVYCLVDGPLPSALRDVAELVSRNDGE
ncbi:hypothetical protein [Natrinema salaciae]|uniref:Helix-turn-helix domain-containing protein n=1 Tax=Natrinema salaciae TaxID=1186196 RepID=A0A1H9EXZ8_9EURY|nr:hypothetical protein [Natrinema salaciae]SEQ29848.1 hypothetical protein SAMN04489841_1398 [Natrinema salaciae]